MSTKTEKMDLMEILRTAQEIARGKILEVLKKSESVSQVAAKLIEEKKINIAVKSLDGTPGIAEDTEIVLEIPCEIRTALEGIQEIRYRLAKSELRIRFEK